MASQNGDTLISNTNDLLLKQELLKQLKLAEKVQKDFLPKKLPQINGLHFSPVYIPAACVSGDIYDIKRLDEDYIGFFVADAVGHSMPAALLTVFLKQALEMRETFTNTYKIFQPEEVLYNLNKKMLEQELSDCLFATAVYCMINIHTRELRFARAGHPYPVVIKSSGEMISLETTGSLLGVFDGAIFSSDSIVLEEGDKLFIYSDGAEPVIGYHDMFGNKEFHFSDEFLELAKLDGKNLAKKIEQMALQTEISEEEVDDITAIILEVDEYI